MERMLYEAAMEGSVASLQELLLQDRLILDRVTVDCNIETPLHIAAMLGHLDFASEILRHKPELARERDSRGFSPLHLASAKGFTEMVRALLLFEPEMCFVCDRYGRNPLHLAAMKGRIGVLQELVRARPHAALVRVESGETILHLCVKHSQLESLRILVETMDDHSELVNAVDDDGFNILQLAVADKQIETISYLLTNTAVEVNAVNLNGCTALDILAQSRRDVQDTEINELLRHAGAARAKDILSGIPNGIPILNRESRNTRTRGLPSNANDVSKTTIQKEKETILEKFTNKKGDWLEKQRSALMIVAVLIATVAFQAGVSPSGDVWGDKSKLNSAGSPSPSPQTFDLHVMGVDFNFPANYEDFLVANTVSLLASFSIVLLLISGLPINYRLFVWILMVITWIAISATAATYMISIWAYTSSQHGRVVRTVVGGGIVVWTIFMLLLLALHSILLILKLIKAIIRSIFRTIKWLVRSIFRTSRGPSTSLISNGTRV